MSDYLKSTNFATKDALPSGNAGKIVKGTEIDNEFNAIADAIESKADLLNPVFSGLLTTDTLTTGGAANVGGTLAVTGALSAADDVQFTGTGRVLVPKGTTAQRPVSAAAGSLRYNTTLGYLENYTGTEWRAVGYVTPADVSDQVNTSTGYFQVPVGTDAQRTFTPAEGLIRYNTTQDIYEGYSNGVWQRFQTFPEGDYSVNYLVVAGGGGGGGGRISGSSQSGGGGGAGGYYTGITTFTPGQVFTITIGAGGPASTNGYNSSISGLYTSIGGGRGGTGNTDGGSPGQAGASGGSGGGGSRLAAGGGATSGQGNAGAYDQGGGGGAGTVGSSGPGGAGGAGASSSISGSTVVYAGGGGAGDQYSPGAGGSGGGGAGGASNASGFNATSNLGGGGGGGGPFDTNGGSGGSGIVFISVPTASYTGLITGLPTVTVVGSSTVLKYTSSGTYTA